MGECPYCYLSDQKKLFNKDRFDIVKCSFCGLLYVINPPSRDSVEGIYDEGYFKGDRSKFGYIDYIEEEELNKVNLRPIADNLIRFNGGSDNGRILDVGCASGSFLTLFGSGWEKSGIDISGYICERAKKIIGSGIYEGDFTDLNFDTNQFDIITFLDSLDHMKDPISNLKKAHRILKAGGMLTITCGDADSLTARLMGRRWYIFIPPTHLFFFSQKTIRKILLDIGFNVEKVAYYGKWASLRLCFFRLAYIIPSGILNKITRFFVKMALGKVKIHYNLFDIMTIYARKK